MLRVADYFGARKMHLVGLSMGGRIARSERTQRVLAPMPATTAEAAATMVGAAAAGP